MRIDDCIFDLYGTLVDIRTDEEKPELWENLYLNYHKKGLTFDSTQLKLEYEKLVKEEILRMKREGQKREEEAWGRSQKAEKEEAQGLSQKTEKEEACSQSQKTEKEEARYLSRVSEYDPEIDLTRVFAQLFEESKPTDPLIWDFGRYFRELSIEKLSLYPEARAMLLAIRAAGKRVWLLTNAQRVFTGPELQKLGIDDCFNGIYISSDYDCKKPDPRFFNILLKEQGIDPAHAIMIGNDGNCDIAGARQVGLHTLYLHSETSPKGDDPVADYKLSEPDMKMVKKILLEENGLR